MKPPAPVTSTLSFTSTLLETAPRLRTGDRRCRTILSCAVAAGGGPDAVPQPARPAQDPRPQERLGHDQQQRRAHHGWIPHHGPGPRRQGAPDVRSNVTSNADLDEAPAAIVVTR